MSIYQSKNQAIFIDKVNIVEFAIYCPQTHDIYDELHSQYNLKHF